MAEDIEFIEGTCPARLGAFDAKDADLDIPGALLAIVEGVMRRSANPEEVGEFERDDVQERLPHDGGPIKSRS